MGNTSTSSFKSSSRSLSHGSIDFPRASTAPLFLPHVRCSWPRQYTAVSSYAPFEAAVASTQEDVVDKNMMMKSVEFASAPEVIEPDAAVPVKLPSWVEASWLSAPPSHQNRQRRRTV